MLLLYFFLHIVAQCIHFGQLHSWILRCEFLEMSCTKSRIDYDINCRNALPKSAERWKSVYWVMQSTVFQSFHKERSRKWRIAHSEHESLTQLTVEIGLPGHVINWISQQA